MARTTELLEERGKRYGSYLATSMIATDLHDVITLYMGYRYKNLRAAQKESLKHICTKISRIVSGDADHIDNWDDIAGYATLVADILRNNEKRDGRNEAPKETTEHTASEPIEDISDGETKAKHGQTICPCC